MRPSRVLERTTVTEAWVLTWTWTLPIDSWRHDRSRMTIAIDIEYRSYGSRSRSDRGSEDMQGRSPFTFRRVLMFFSSDAPSRDKLMHNAWAMSSINPPLPTLLCPVTVMSTKPHLASLPCLPLLPRSQAQAHNLHVPCHRNPWLSSSTDAAIGTPALLAAATAVDSSKSLDLSL